MVKYLTLPIVIFLFTSCFFDKTETGKGVENNIISTPESPGIPLIGLSQEIEDSNSGSMKNISPNEIIEVMTGTNEDNGKGGKPNGGLVENTGTLVMENTDTGSVKWGIVLPKKGLTPEQKNRMDISGVIIFESDVELVEQSKTIAELERHFPEILNDSAKTHPRYFEYQKKRLLLKAYFSDLIKTNPEFAALNQKQMDMNLGKEIWPTELKEIDEKLQIINSKQGNEETPDDADIRLKHFQLFQSFQESQEYKDYSLNTGEDLNKLNQEILNYMPSNLIQIQADVSTLYDEIYGNNQ